MLRCCRTDPKSPVSPEQPADVPDTPKYFGHIKEKVCLLIREAAVQILFSLLVYNATYLNNTTFKKNSDKYNMIN